MFVVLLAVLALVLLMLLLQSRGALASTQETLASTQRDLVSSRTRTTELDARVAELDIARSEAEELVGELRTELAAENDRATAAEANTAELEAARADAETTRSQIETALTERTEALADAQSIIETRNRAAEEQAAEILDLTHQSEQLQVELVEAADKAAKQRAPTVPSVLVSDDGADLDVPGYNPSMAWELELVRSARTWRYSVAANPVEDANPFDGAENPLKLAVEIEALALREDVGAFIGIDWRAGNTIDPDIDPARAHLTLRLAQELLASAAREMSPSTLIVVPDPARGGVSLEVVASDPDDVDFKIPPPPIASEWIGIDEHGGMVVTVRVD